MIKAIVFDADNTLYKIHQENAYKKKFEFLSKKTGIDKERIERTWRNVLKEIAGSKNPEKRTREYSTKKTLIQLGIKKERAEKLTGNVLKIFWQQVIKDLEVSPKIKGTIERLGKRYTLIIASDEFRNNLEKKLNKVVGNWKKYFKFLVTPEDTKEMKPSKKYYQIILKKSNFKPEEILVVGDSWERDLELAERFGMKTKLIEHIGDIR